MTRILPIACLSTLFFLLDISWAFVGPALPCSSFSSSATCRYSQDNNDDVLDQAIAMMMGGGGGTELETPDMVQGRIQNLIEAHPVLLFMKGAKRFPQCGFSDTATKILDRYVDELSSFEDYYTVDVLEDDKIRDGIKIFSDWPTIPQLYVRGEFIGGSDIMVQMFESGELKQVIEQALMADESS